MFNAESKVFKGFKFGTKNTNWLILEEDFEMKKYLAIIYVYFFSVRSPSPIGYTAVSAASQNRLFYLSCTRFFMNVCTITYNNMNVQYMYNR